MTEVTQADREAAWPYRPSCYKDDFRTQENWMAGMYDNAGGVPIHAFAAHRRASTQADKLVEAAFLEGYSLVWREAGANQAWLESDARQALKEHQEASK